MTRIPDHLKPRYKELLRKGNSPNMAAVLTLRKFPGIHGTDVSFLEGAFEDDGKPMTKLNYKIAHEAGVVTTGKVYKSGLADHRGPADPEAWVSGVDDVKRVCRERNKTCSGAVKHEVPEYDYKKEPQIRLAEDIVQDCMREEIEANPDQAHNKNLREEVIEKYGAPLEDQ